MISYWLNITEPGTIEITAQSATAILRQYYMNLKIKKHLNFKFTEKRKNSRGWRARIYVYVYRVQYVFAVVFIVQKNLRGGVNGDQKKDPSNIQQGRR